VSRDDDQEDWSDFHNLIFPLRGGHTAKVKYGGF
jgi:hypothetical protein